MSIYDTGHAVCMTTLSSGELLIHAGIDTVKWKAEDSKVCGRRRLCSCGRCTS
ncbi:MAG: PTS glucose transporter subunit IIA [Mediterraneibacter gnavus]